MEKQGIIVLGTTHHNTLGVIRALGESQLHLHCILVLYGEKESYLSRSKYVKETIFVPEAEGITDTLLGISLEEKQIVIAVTDESVHQLDLNADRLSPFYYFFHTTTKGNLTRFMDKLEQDKTAEEVGLIVPANYTKDAVSYPCLLKPLASIAGGKQVLICNNQNDYEAVNAKYPDTRFQIQQYVHKEQEIVLVGMSVDGVVHIPAYVLKHREISGGTTYSTVRPITELEPTIIDKSKALVKKIGYEGLFGIEYILSKGKYYFIEVNLRNDATCYAVAVAGVNLPLAYVLAKQGEDLQSIVNAPIHVTNAMVEFRDFEFVLGRKMGLFKWLRQRKGCECKYFYSIEDKEPYIFNKKMLLNRIRHMFSSKIKRLLKLKK